MLDKIFSQLVPVVITYVLLLLAILVTAEVLRLLGIGV